MQSIQEEHASNVTQLADKLGGLAEINSKHQQLLQHNSWLEKELTDTKTSLRHNRNLNSGVDHLWSVKEAEYSNINSILKQI